MGIREDYSYMKELKAARASIRESAEKQRVTDFNEAVIAHEDKKAAHEAALDRFYAYKDTVRKTLLETALLNIYEMSFNTLSVREKALCENLLDQYVTEAGTSVLLKNMKRSDSGLLRKIAEEVEEYYTDITKVASVDDPESQVITPEAINNFWKEIDKSDNIEDITSLIRLRVSNAEEQFVNKNAEDKNDVKDIMKQTAARVQMAKNTNDNDYSEMVEESETRIAKDKIYSVQHEGYHNVFHRMVSNLSEVAIKNEDARKEFIDGNGRLNMDKIVESARCMYTLLEMVGTIQLEKVDGKYIEDTLKSIK